MLGKLCKFWNNDKEYYYGILCKVYNGSTYPYTMLGCNINFKNCEVLSIKDLQNIQENKIDDTAWKKINENN